MNKKRPITNNDLTPNKSKKIKTSASNNFWALGLLKSMEDPDLQVKSDDTIVIIKDKYPKAKFHYLILPKEEISNLKRLTEKHVKLLKHMEKEAEKLIDTKKHFAHNFKMGFHAEASMHRLHMHVISDDMVSDCLKNKIHWNSFTSDFFLDAKDIRHDLEKNGKITIVPSSEKIKELKNTSLKCHKCRFVPKNIPDLKKHILTHLSNIESKEKRILD